MNYDFLIVLGENCPACFHFEQNFLGKVKTIVKNKYKDFLTYKEVKTIMDRKNVEKNLNKLNPRLKDLIKGFPSIFIYNVNKLFMYDMNDGIEPQDIEKWIMETKQKIFKLIDGSSFTVLFLTAEKCPACEHYVNSKKIDEHIKYIESKKIKYIKIESVNLVINALLGQLRTETDENKKKELEKMFKTYSEKLRIEKENLDKIHKDLMSYTLFFPCVVIFKNSDLHNKDKKLNGIMCGYKLQNKNLSNDERYNLNNFEEWIDYCIENYDIYLESIEVMDDYRVFFRTTKKLEDLKIFKNNGVVVKKKKLNFFSKKMY